MAEKTVSLVPNSGQLFKMFLDTFRVSQSGIIEGFPVAEHDTAHSAIHALSVCLLCAVNVETQQVDFERVGRMQDELAAFTEASSMRLAEKREAADG